jgi:hypothetical protein
MMAVLERAGVLMIVEAIDPRVGGFAIDDKGGRDLQGQETVVTHTPFSSQASSKGPPSLRGDG